MFHTQSAKNIVDVSSYSLSNIDSELSAIKNIVETMDDIDEIKSFIDNAFGELRYNISLLPEGVEYRSDEYSFIYDSMRECK